MKNTFLLLVFFSLYWSYDGFSQIIINEVQYGNKSTLFDDDGDTPDWIELYNSGNKTVSLESYKINDANNSSTAWVFPKVTLNSNQYLLVYASGKNIKEVNNLHTDFKLRILKDSLFLFDARGQIIDSIIPECIPTNKALGYIAKYTDRKIIDPTPGKLNSDSIIYGINYNHDTLMVDKSSGKYSNGVEITFTNNNPNNAIYYTLNGDEPDVESLLFSESITLNDISLEENRFAKKVEEFECGDLIAKASIIRAQVFSEGCPSSSEISNTYFVGSENSFKYNVPLVSIITEKDNLFGDEIGIYVEGNHSNVNKKGSDWEREAHIEYFDTTGFQLIDQNAGIRLHGRSSRWIAQKSFRLYAKEKYGKATFEYPFFSQKPQLSSFKTLLLRTTYADWSQTLFKDELCHNIVDPMNMDYMAGQTSIVFVNGEYWGIYSLRERQDEYYVENNHNIKDPELDLISFDAGPHVKSGSIDNYQNLLDWLQNNDPKEAYFYTEVEKKIDLENMTDYFIAQLYLAQFDFPNLNIDMWRSVEDTAKWRYFFFDLDAAMIKINYDHLSNYNNSIENIQRFKYEEEYIFSRLLENETFRNNFYIQYLHHMETTFSTNRILNLIDFFEKEYTPLVVEQSYRWEKPIDFHKWCYNLNELKDFAILRPNVVMDQLLKNFDNPFTVFPNPSRGNFTLSIDDPIGNEVNYSIYNAQGNSVINNQLLYGDGSNIQVNLGSGIYMLQVRISGFYFREKIIVQ